MSKQHSAIIKGMAILLMLVYHLPHLIDPETFNPFLRGFLSNISHPVEYFLIVSGYGLFYAHRHHRLTWPYLLKRTLRLYVAFWLVLGIFVFALGPWVAPGVFRYTFKTIVTNLIGWRWDYCQFTWFLLTYVLLSFAAKWIFQVMDRIGNVASVVLSLVASLGATWLIGRHYPFFRDYYLLYHIMLAIEMLFTFVLGAIMARLVLDGKEITWSKLRGRNALVVLLMLAVFALAGYRPIHSVPLFVIVIVWLVIHIEPAAVSKYLFIPLGDKSMMMWFLHGYLGPKMFCDYYQPLHYHVLIWLVWVIVTYLVACLLSPVSDWICKRLKLSSSTPKVA